MTFYVNATSVKTIHAKTIYAKAIFLKTMLVKPCIVLLIFFFAGCQSLAPEKTTQTTAPKPVARVAGHGMSEVDRQAYIAEHDTDGDESVSRAEIEAFRKARFNDGDVNRNGVLDEDEYVDEYAARLEQQIFAERKAHTEQTHTRFKSLDKNTDGVISWEEYQASGERAFAHWDKQNTGRIVAQGDEKKSPRSRSVLSMPTSHSMQGFLELYDEDANGLVTREEFNQHRQNAFAATDSNKDGVLSAEEYLLEFEGRVDRQAESVREQQLKQAHVRFDVLDKNKSGAIEWDEYLAIGLRGFERWDVNSDGIVSAADPLPEKQAWQRPNNAAKKSGKDDTKKSAGKTAASQTH